MAEASRQRKHKNTGGNHVKEPLRRDEVVCLQRHKWVSQPIRPIVVQLQRRSGPNGTPGGRDALPLTKISVQMSRRLRAKRVNTEALGNEDGLKVEHTVTKTPVQYF